VNINLAGARAVQSELVNLTNNGELAPWVLACVAAEVGDTDNAVAWARDAVRRRDPMALAILRQPPEEALRALVAWPEIEAAMRLPVSDARSSNCVTRLLRVNRSVLLQSHSARGVPPRARRNRVAG